MPYVITQPCIGTKDASCYDVCPVDAIQPAPGARDDIHDQMFIDPAACIDCGACQPACPVQAIYSEDEVPERWRSWIAINKCFFDPATAAKQ